MDNLISSNVLDYQGFLDNIFETFLIEQHVSAITRKNYRSDLRNFFNWIVNVIQFSDKNIPSSFKKIVTHITVDQLEDYKRDLLLKQTPESTINRRLSSLRMFFRYAEISGWITNNPMILIRNISISSGEQSAQKLLHEFAKSLTEEGASAITIKNYVTDVAEFLNWLTRQPLATTNNVN